MSWPFKKFHNTALFPNSLIIIIIYLILFLQQQQKKMNSLASNFYKCIWTSWTWAHFGQEVPETTAPQEENLEKTHKDFFFFKWQEFETTFLHKETTTLSHVFFCIYCCMTHDVWSAEMNERKKNGLIPPLSHRVGRREESHGDLFTQKCRKSFARLCSNKKFWAQKSRTKAGATRSEHEPNRSEQEEVASAKTKLSIRRTN